MQKIKFIAFGLFCFVVTTANAQLPKASEYFPLQVGNVWQYKEQYAPGQFTGAPDRFLEIVSDSLLGDTLRIYKSQGSSLESPDSTRIGYAYYHYNTDSTIVYRYLEFPQTPYAGLPMINTGHGVGHRWLYIWGDCVCTFSVTDTGTAQFFNQSMQWLDVNTVYPDYDSLVIDMELWRYVFGIGPVKNGNDTLIYAKINGVEYGTPTQVRAGPKTRHSVPKDFTLHVYPNPMNSSAVISLDNFSGTMTEIKIIDVLGRTVRTLTNQSHAGPMTIQWNGRDDTGRILPVGVYFVTARTEDIFRNQKIIYVR